jgi:thioredoxin 1
MIPTQIFYGADGKELFRHEGFYAKKDILAKWRELGVAIREPVAPATQPATP